MLGCLFSLMALGMLSMAMMGPMMAKSQQCGAANTVGPLAKSSPCPAMNMQMMIPGAVLYLAIGATFILLGVGSMRPPLGLDPERGAGVDVVDYGRGWVRCGCFCDGAGDVGVHPTTGKCANTAGSDCGDAELLAYLAWGTYRLKMAAWWGTLLLWIAGILNMMFFSQTGLMEMYEKMKMPAAQLEMM